MADDVGMVAKILAVAGLEVTGSARGAFEMYLAGNPRGKDGRVVYDLRNDFGVEPGDLHERFAFYYEAFPQIRKEVR